MPGSNDARFRTAGPGDADAIAVLHADSWRRHYRGAFSDAFLDNDVTGYLRPLWTERLARPDPRARTILAERDDEVVGLAHTILGEDATWGAFLDNLHVAYGLKRQGIGSRLMALTAQAVLDSSPSSGLYLWVLEQNSAGRAFYAALGGVCVEGAQTPSPGGDAAHLNGKPISLRYVWRNPSELLAGRLTLSSLPHDSAVGLVKPGAASRAVATPEPATWCPSAGASGRPERRMRHFT